MELFKYDSREILETEVGWCEPVVYTFNKSGQVVDFKLLPRPEEPSKSHFPKYKISV